MHYIYNKANTLQKREFVNMVFNSNLYYQDGIYRTSTMMDIFANNYLDMKEKGYLVYKKKDDSSIIPFSGLRGITIEYLIPLLLYFYKVG